MTHITFEQFLHYTNAEEIIIQKLKEAGPRKYKLNYDRRFKHCKVLYQKFFDVKLRNKVLEYGLTLKPMPNCFKAKFLQFPQTNNNDGEHINSDTQFHQSELKTNIETNALEDKYKDDMPSTSTALVHKPRLLPQSGSKAAVTTATNSKSRRKSSPKNKKNSYNPPWKYAPKRLSLEKEKSSNKSPKITKYFINNTNAQPIVKRNMRSRLLDVSNEITETEPQTKVPKMSPHEQTKSKEVQNNSKFKIHPLSSETKSKGKNKTNAANKKIICVEDNEDKNVKQRLHSDDFLSDDPDINTNDSVISIKSDVMKEQINCDGKQEQYLSPTKSFLPKRNRTEDYGNASNAISKETSPAKIQFKNGVTKEEIELWIKNGQKCLEESGYDNERSCDGASCDNLSISKVDIPVNYKTKTIETNADRVKKYIKYWLKFYIKLKKRINSEQTTFSETSTAKLLSAFSQMTYEEFKNLVNVEKHILQLKLSGESKSEAEQNFKNQHKLFIQKEKSWPLFQIELGKLQSYLIKKGCKGPILLKYIPPRLLTFDETLEKTNIKEHISLSCEKPPDSYKELLSLCKKEYEKCCVRGVWAEGLKFVKKSQTCGSSEEMSIELCIEPTTLMSPLKVTESENDLQNVVPKSRQKRASKNDDNLENKLSHICGNDEQTSFFNTTEFQLSGDPDELSFSAHNENVLSSVKGDSLISHSFEKIIDNRPEEVLLKIKQLNTAKNQSSKMEKPLTPSPNIFTCSDETNTKCSNDVEEDRQSKNLEITEVDEVMLTAEGGCIAKELPAVPSANIFLLSRETHSECVDHGIVQIQESVYVACKTNNNFNTEQYNFSIDMNEVSKGEDPIGEDPVGEDPIGVDPIGESIINENNTERINRDQSYQLNLPENSTLLLNKTTKENIEPEENTAFNQVLSSPATSVFPEILENTDNQGKASEPSYKHLNVVTINKCNSTDTPASNTSDFAIDMVQNREKDIQNGNIKSVTLVETPRRNSVNSVQVAENINDMNENANIMKNLNAILDKDTHNESKNLETDTQPQSLSEPIRNVVVKRETVFRQLSGYDDDVEIIDIPLSEAMVIDDEESTAELLDILLCNSSPDKAPPMTIIHTNISHTTSSVYLHNFPQAQQIPSNLDLTQSQQNLNQSSSLTTSGQECNQNENVTCQPEIMTNRTENDSHQPSHNQNDILLQNNSSNIENAMQPSEKSETSYISITPQNIPSDIEFSQTSLNKKEYINTISVNNKQIKNCEMKSSKIAHSKQINQSFQRNQSTGTETIEFPKDHTEIYKEASKELVSTYANNSLDRSSDVELVEESNDDESSDEVNFQGKFLQETGEQCESYDQFTNIIDKNFDDNDVLKNKELSHCYVNSSKTDLLTNEERNADSSVEIVCVDDSEDEEIIQEIDVASTFLKESENNNYLSTLKSQNEEGNVNSVKNQQVLLNQDECFRNEQRSFSTSSIDHTFDRQIDTVQIFNLSQEQSLHSEKTEKSNRHMKVSTKHSAKGITKENKQKYEKDNQTFHKRSLIIANEKMVNNSEGGFQIGKETEFSKITQTPKDIKPQDEETNHVKTVSINVSLNRKDIDSKGNVVSQPSKIPIRNLSGKKLGSSKSEDFAFKTCSPKEESNDSTNDVVYVQKDQPSCSKSISSKNLVSTEMIMDKPQDPRSTSLNVVKKSADVIETTNTQEQFINKIDFEKVTTILNSCDPCNEIMNVNCKYFKAPPHKETYDQENLRSSTALLKKQRNSRNVMKENYALSQNNMQALKENFSTEELPMKNLETTLPKQVQEMNQETKKNNVNRTLRPRTISENVQSSKSFTVVALSCSQPNEVNYSTNCEVSTESSKPSSEEIIEKSATIALQGLIPFVNLENIQSRNDNYVEVPVLIDKKFLNILSQIKISSDLSGNDFSGKSHAILINIELQENNQQVTCINPTSLSRHGTKKSSPHLFNNEQSRKNDEEKASEVISEHNNNLLKLNLMHSKKTRIPQSPVLKKKIIPKKSSKLPDFVQQKTHAFLSIPLKTCSKTSKSKSPNCLSVEECDYLIEESSQATSTVSQILGTDCTYFENSELLRNLEDICVPVVPEQQIQQPPLQDLTSRSSSCKVTNLIAITVSEGVTARKVWQVNLQWKRRKAMSIEVKFSVNQRTMIACDEPAKLLFYFSSNTWLDIQRILREIDHFEYKRRALKNQLRSTALHTVLRELFDSSTQIVNVKLMSDSYNPFTICEKATPIYREPFQCLTKGITPDILHKMKLIKESL